MFSSNVHGDIGLVLSGGGAKGAYQAGVWKALCERGIDHRVRVISGTSIGAVNACAFSQIRDPDRIAAFWFDNIESIPTPNFEALSPERLLSLIDAWVSNKPFPFLGLLDRRHLEITLDSLLPDRWRRDSPDVFATSLQCRGGVLESLSRYSYSLKRFRIDGDLTKRDRILRVLASCAIPWGFDPVDLDGVPHIDGGWTEMGGDNVPVSPILEKYPEIRELIVILCNGPEMDVGDVPATAVALPTVKVIRPSRQMPGIFDAILAPAESLAQILGRPNPKVWSGTLSFSESFSRLYFNIGYRDGLAAFPVPRKHLVLDI